VVTQRSAPVTLGLRANWRQFWLLVAVNAFVGALVGLERTVLPLLAEHDFGLTSRSAALSASRRSASSRRSRTFSLAAWAIGSAGSTSWSQGGSSVCLFRSS
jgi:hypothetical protein